MSDRTDVPTAQPVWRNKLVVGIGTSVVAIVVTGIALQFLSGSSNDAKAQPAAPTGGSAKGAKDSTYMARVGRQLITQDDLAAECMDRYGREVLENIINRTIVQQACAEAGITVTQAEVNNEIRKIAKTFNIPVDTWLKMLGEERGLTPAQYARDVIWPKLALEKLARPDVSVSEKDLKKAFNRDYGPRVKAKMIMFDNLRRAQTVWEEVVKKPADFERLARQHSIEPNSRSLGGQIPPIRWQAGNSALEEAAFKLRTGEISGIVQVGYNRYVVLLSEGRTEPIVTNMEDVRKELTELIKDEKMQAAVASRFDEIKRTTRVDNYLANTSYGGEDRVEQTSGTRPDTSGVRNAAGTATLNDADPARRAARDASITGRPVRNN